MREKLILFIKGFMIGIGKIIPGVSGGMIAISLGVYDRGVDAIANFFRNPNKNLAFLLTIGLGIVAAIMIGSNIIVFFIKNCYLPTMLLFVGLISGGLPSLYSSINIKKHFFYVIIPIIFMLMMTMSSVIETGQIVNANFITLFFVGAIEAFAMVIPGISGTAFLMLIGYYETIMKAYGTFNLSILIPFLWGASLFALLFVKLVSYMLSKHREKSYAMIFGFASGSLGILFFDTLKSDYYLIDILIGLSFLVIGYMCSRFLDKSNL